MRPAIIVTSLMALTACQPAATNSAPPSAEPPAESSAPAEGPAGVAFTIVSEPGVVRLDIDEGADDLRFVLTCKAEGPQLVATGAISQVALGNMAMPYGISLSGMSFEAELLADDQQPAGLPMPTFSVKTPLTPDVLSALGGASTARIMVNDNYAYVESGLDSGDNFESFAADCAALTGLTPSP